MDTLEGDKKINMENNLEQVKTVEDFDKVLAFQKQQISILKYVTLGSLLPPITTILTFYFAWKKKALYRLLPVTTIVYSVLFGLYSYVLLNSPKALVDVLGPKLAQAPVVDSAQNMILVILSVILTILGTAGGFYLKIKAAKAGGLSRGKSTFLLAILVLQFIVGVWQFSFITSAVSGAVGSQDLGF